MFKNKLVYFASLGCSKNRVDAEVMLGKLSEYGFALTESPEEAEVIVVNTCGFIHDAKEESINTILELIDYKTEGQCQLFAVTGCLSQRHPEELEQEIPEVDLFIGTGEYHRLVDLIIEKERYGLEKKQYVAEPIFIHTEEDPRINTSPFYSAWLKIAEGCNRRCSFCIIPTLRGKLRSRTVESLIVEAQGLVKSGVRELNLISQDTSLYGKDLKDSNTLVHLLDELEKIEGLDWIRLFYIYPDDLTDEVIEKMASSKKICHYLDIPIQHFSDAVLTRMNRKVRGEKIIERVEKLRAKIPDIVLRTSLLVGFPGETDEDFQTLLKGMERLRFDHLGVFAFSPEEGTPAYDMDGQIEQDVKEERQRLAYELQEEIVEENNQKYLGQTLEVLVEGLHEETELLIVGRHQGQAPEIDGQVLINDLNDQEIKQGDLVKVQVSEVLGFDLVGALV